IDSYLTDVSETVFSETPMIRDAVLRNLEIISEASRRLSDEFKERHPGIPWPAVAAAGNVYRHDYHAVNEEIVWQTATTGLAGLREVLKCEQNPGTG
ncbi:MAG TPA: HepT-like ribonuclease domain-containing protein, partial [Candidatus Elarobacter sp.]|nr:HepT-like ribonuclease domain-containing protein [Candidatus Elarobacter sp.]